MLKFLSNVARMLREYPEVRTDVRANSLTYEDAVCTECNDLSRRRWIFFLNSINRVLLI